MIKVLLVDDNKFALKFFEQLVNWEEQGFCIVAKAIDGPEALKLYKKHQPSLVITDVSMPGMNGMELAAKIKEINPNATIIFLSSYDEFDYARSALNLGVNDYILKHEITQEKLCKKLSQLKMSMHQQNVKTKLYEEDILYKILMKPESEELARYYFSKKYHLYLIEQDHCLPAMLEFVPDKTPEADPESVKKICYSFSERILAVKAIECYQYAVLIENIDEEKMNSLLYSLKSELNNRMNSSFSMFLLCISKPIDECAEAFRRLRSITEQRYFVQVSSVLNFLFYQTPHTDITGITVKEIEAILKKKNVNKLLQFIDQLYMKAIQEKNYAALSEITKVLVGFLHQYDNKLVDFQTGKIFKLYDRNVSMQWYTAGEIALWIKSKYEQYSSIAYNNSIHTYSFDVQAALSYIYHNYHDVDLSVERVAAAANLSVNRMNVLFHSEIGSTVGKYLTRYRLEKAKTLLRTTQNISDIPSQIGFSSVQYFSRAFKNSFGCTPQEFKKGKEIAYETKI